MKDYTFFFFNVLNTALFKDEKENMEGKNFTKHLHRPGF